MKPTDLISESAELSLGLKKILIKAGICDFKELASYTRLDLISKLPKLKVRHLANLEQLLYRQDLDFVTDDSIRLDDFINQRKLFNLWERGVYTYLELDNLNFSELEHLLGGPQSLFFRNKEVRQEWLLKNNLSLFELKRIDLPHLTDRTADLLYNVGIRSLQETIQKNDYQLAQILQPGFGTTKAPLRPLTKARLLEIKYALLKEGLSRPFKPL